MFSSKSFVRQKNAVLQTLGIERSEFDSWPMEELAMHLRDDGVDVPPDVNPHDLVAFAEAFYGERTERPQRYSIHTPEFIDANGVAYIPRPKNRNHPHHHQQRNQQQASLQTHVELPVNSDSSPRPSALGGAAPDITYRHVLANPPMFPSEMTDEELAQLRERDDYLHTDDLGAIEVVEEDDPRVHGEAPETAEIRENFRFIEDEEATEARIKNEFQRPSIQVAERFAALNHPRKADGSKYSVLWTNTGRFCFSRGRGCFRLIDPFGEGATSELAKYGVGISLYFKTLKWLFWIFFLMSLCVLPEMVINAQGGSRPQSSLFSFDSTFLGHLADSTFFVNASGGSNSTILRGFDTSPLYIPLTNCDGSLCTVSRATVGLWYTAMDLVSIGIFVIGLRWLQYFTNVEGSRITKHHITVEEYTIQIVSVPEDSTELSLKKFFSDLTGEPVHDVHLVQDNGQLLNLYVKRGKLIDKLWKQAATVHLLKEDRRTKPGEHAIKDDAVLVSKLDRAVKKYDRTYAQFVNLNEERAKMNPGNKALSAFVTFETQQGFLKAMDLYPPGYYNRRNQPPELRLAKKPLKVRQAPPPTTILWENTHYKWSSRRWRRWLTMIGTTLALGVTVVVVFFTDRQRNTLKQAIFSEECTLIDQLNAGTLNSTYIHNMTDLANVLQNIEDQNPNFTAIANLDSAIRDCFCSSLSFSDATTAIFNPGSLCNYFYIQKTPLYALTLLATLVISGVNILIQYVIFYFSEFEKHHSLVNMELSIARRVFVVLVINTGLILLAVNAAFPGAIWIGSGTFSDFSSDWYSSVGLSLTLTMILNIITPHLFPLLGYWYFAVVKRNHLAYSQRELNELYLGPQFFLSYRSAQLLMTVFVSMLYSAGIPALYPIATAMFLVNFYVDKYLLFNYYRTPPSYSEKLSEWFVGTLSYAVIGHLGFATWMYSAKGIFWDGSSSDTSELAVYLGLSSTIDDGSFDFTRRLSQTNVLPLYITLLIMVLLKLFSFCFTWIDRIRQLLCVTVTCGIFDDGTIKRRYLNPDYTDALERGELRGLVNYNMLENPTYTRALGIDAKFAKEHRHIASVHEASAVQLPHLPKSFKIAPLEEAERRASKKKDEQDAERDSSNDNSSSTTGRPLSLNRRSAAVEPVGDEESQGARSRGNSRVASQRLGHAFGFEDEPRQRSSSGAGPGPTGGRASIARTFQISPEEFD